MTVMSTTTTLLVDGMTCDHCVASIRKAVGGVAELGREAGVPVVAVVGDADPDVEAPAGIEVVSLLELLFWLMNRTSSSFCRSSALPFFAAASNAFMVGP